MIALNFGSFTFSTAREAECHFAPVFLAIVYSGDLLEVERRALHRRQRTIL
jgi:hypothetical protein